MAADGADYNTRSQRFLVGFLVVSAVLLFSASYQEIRVMEIGRGGSITIHRRPPSPNAVPTDDGREPPASSSSSSSSFLFAKDDVGFKPLQNMVEDCEYLPSQPVQRVRSFRNESTSATLARLETRKGSCRIPGLSICRYDATRGGHFPHILQHVYACYAVWQRSSPQRPVWYVESAREKQELYKTFAKSPFLKGLLEALVEEGNLRIWTKGEIHAWLQDNSNTTASSNRRMLTGNETSSKSSNHSRTDGKECRQKEGEAIDFEYVEVQSPVGYVLSHATALQDTVRKHLGMKSVADEERFVAKLRRNSAARETNCPLPRIGFLNRKPINGRSIINAQEIINNATVFNVTHEVHATVVSTHFEGASLLDQVAFFAGNDVVVSPHGAQLSGLPFLGHAPCTQLLEVFPENYLLPDFFGTLALASGVGYSYVYAAPGNPGAIAAARERSGVPGRIVPSAMDRRVRAKKQNLCLAPHAVRDALEEAVRGWCECWKGLAAPVATSRRG